eukprot:5525481-Lingulodinium_polyedra.AAC.1
MVCTSKDWKMFFPDPFYLCQAGYLTAINVDPDETHIINLGFCFVGISLVDLMLRQSLTRP